MTLSILEYFFFTSELSSPHVTQAAELKTTFQKSALNTTMGTNFSNVLKNACSTPPLFLHLVRSVHVDKT